MGWNWLSIPKLQRLHRWSLWMDKQFHPTFYWKCGYLSKLGLKLIYNRKGGHAEYITTAVWRCLKLSSQWEHIFYLKVVPPLDGKHQSAVAMQAHSRVCHAQWPLTLTYIFQIIRPWLFNKLLKYHTSSHIRSPACTILDGFFPYLAQ